MSGPIEKTPSDCWEEAMAHLCLAMTFYDPMKDAPTQQKRDQATKGYVASVDRMVEALAPLAFAGLLDDVGAFLDAQFGRV